jgi:hypothetical protein
VELIAADPSAVASEPLRTLLLDSRELDTLVREECHAIVGTYKNAGENGDYKVKKILEI